MRRARLNTIRNRLFLSTVVVVGVAVALIYLYVVPQLESSLTSERLDGIEQRALSQLWRLEPELTSEPDEEELASLTESVSRAAGARVTLIESESFGGAGEGPPNLVVTADSGSQDSLSTDSEAIAREAVSSGLVVKGIGVGTTGRRAEVAVPVDATGSNASWVVTFSEPLTEVEQNVASIRRQILVAVIIAMVIAIVIGFVASSYLARRLRNLERAARKFAAGDFTEQVPTGPRDELGEVAYAFNEMQVRLADLDRARRQFIANASHELRTPIFSLGGFIELLDEEELDEETREGFVKSMREQIDRLTKLTADLLDLSKLDSGAVVFTPEPVDLGALSLDIAREFGPRADSHGSRLEVRTPSEPAIALADPNRTGQVIRILLDNAVVHTPPGTKVTMTSQSRGARVELTVFDQGPGIPKNVQRRMFDRFYTAAESGGSGLGLAIARSLALRMNGNITYKGGKGRTSFTLDLPAAPAADRAQRPREVAG